MSPVNNYAAWRFYLDVLVLVGVIFNTVYTWWANRARINNKRFVTLEQNVAEKISDQEARDIIDQQLKDCEKHRRHLSEMRLQTSRIETEMRQMPGRREIATLNTCITSLTEKIARLDGKFEGVNRAVDLMNEYLINQGDK